MTAGKKRRHPGFKFENRVLLLSLLSGLPAALLALILLWVGNYSSRLQWTLTVLVLVAWWGLVAALHERVIHPLQTLANLLEALREEDYSVRARGARHDDALGEVMAEINTLSVTLRERRLDALEAGALLRRVMEEIDVAVFTFDSEQRLRLVNRAGERLLGRSVEQLMRRTAGELNLADCLSGQPTLILEKAFPGAPGGAIRWGISRSTFREKGLPHQLLVVTDLSRPLREGERQAWQRLIRVLGHELNNSLAPIRSLARSLADLLSRQPRPADWQEDTQKGLRIIASRAEALSRFMEAYSLLARLPAPRLRAVRVGALVERVAELESRVPVRVVAGPELVLQADEDQMEQLLINLLRNAADAVQETGGGVAIGWSQNAAHLEVWVEDEGPGLSSTANLFVPFFTTKPGGTGIGLALSRQIAEVHGGSLTLENRRDRPGCKARLQLPMLSPFQ